MSEPTVVPFNKDDRTPLGIEWANEHQFPGGAMWHAEPAGPLLELCEVNILDDPDKDRVTVRLVVSVNGHIKSVTFRCQRAPSPEPVSA
jgi:hypothetical protein